MALINIQENKVKYNKRLKRFAVSGKNIPFDTAHYLVNQLSGNSLEFYFSHSTGSEWDTDTKWVYKTHDDKYTFYVGNEDVTEQHRQNYLDAKTRR